MEKYWVRKIRCRSYQFSYGMKVADQGYDHIMLYGIIPWQVLE